MKRKTVRECSFSPVYIPKPELNQVRQNNSRARAKVFSTAKKFFSAMERMKLNGNENFYSHLAVEITSKIYLQKEDK